MFYLYTSRKLSHNLNFCWRWYDWIQATFYNLFYINQPCLMDVFLLITLIQRLKTELTLLQTFFISFAHCITMPLAHCTVHDISHDFFSMPMKWTPSRRSRVRITDKINQNCQLVYHLQFSRTKVLLCKSCDESSVFVYCTTINMHVWAKILQ